MCSYNFYENGIHVLDVVVTRTDCGLRLKATMGKNLDEIIGTRLKDRLGEDFVVVNITLGKSENADMLRLLPTIHDQDVLRDDYLSTSQKEFFMSSSRTLRRDTPQYYSYLLSFFYVRVKDHLILEAERNFFKGIGASLLCWLLRKIDNSGESILALEADGSSSSDPECRTRDQKSLVAFYEKLGFKVCAKEVDEVRFWNSAVCMYSKFSNVISNCQQPRFRAVNAVFDGF